MPAKPHLFVIVSDTLRADFVGCYGNDRIRTPNLDRFAADATLFDAAYPESLPTIPVRRALHSGRRAYPFHQYRAVPWDIVYLPGWQPLFDEQPAVAENLVQAGYYTGFVTDTLPYFAPAMNFTRGFWQWEYVRGQQQDRWQSPATARPDRLARYGLKGPLPTRAPFGLHQCHAANTAGAWGHEEETTTARCFRWAMQFAEDNRQVGPLYLMVDCFVPHEPWEAPPSYYELYADPAYRGPCTIHPRYCPRAEQGLSWEQVADIKAHYCGLVTLFDAWFGRFLDTLRRLDLYDNALIVLTSDHGTNFGDNPREIVGKPGHAMYPGVMHVPLLVRFPGGEAARQRVGDLVYTLDVPATLYAQGGVTGKVADGQDLTAAVRGTAPRREYLTCRYGNGLWYRDQRYWLLLNTARECPEAFDLTTDPRCQQNIRDQLPAAVLSRAWERLVADAGGEIPVYQGAVKTDAIGRAT